MNDPEQAANAMITLINQTTYLLDQQLKAVRKQMEEKGLSMETHNQKIGRVMRKSAKSKNNSMSGSNKPMVQSNNRNISRVGRISLIRRIRWIGLISLISHIGLISIAFLAPLPAQAQCCVCETQGSGFGELDEDEVEVCLEEPLTAKGKLEEVCDYKKPATLFLQEEFRGRPCYWKAEACSEVVGSKGQKLCTSIISEPKLVNKTGEILDIPVPDRKPIDFTPSVSIPGTCFEAGKPISETCPPPKSGEKGITAATLALYIAGLYYFIIASIGILAVVGIMIGGFQYLMAAGSPEKITEAKTSITSAIIGLIIALTSYLLFNTINPNLVKFGEGIESLKDVNAEQVYALRIGGAGSGCPVESELLPLSSSGIDSGVFKVSPNADDPRLAGNAMVDLQTLFRNQAFVKWLKTNQVKLEVNDAYRKMRDQIVYRQCWEYSYSLDAANRICPYACTICNEAAVAGCKAPHQTGMALDVCLRATVEINAGNAACGMGKSENNNVGLTSGGSDMKTTLQTFFNDAGWGRYCCEWWHFESPDLVKEKGGSRGLNAPRYCAPGEYPPPWGSATGKVDCKVKDSGDDYKASR